MTHTDHNPDLLTSASALALYDQATDTADKLRAAAAMAHVLRTAPPAPKKRPVAAKAAPSDMWSAESLSAALKRLCGVIERRNTIPVLSCVRIEAKPGSIRLTGTDLDLEYVEVLRGDIGTFSASVPAASLASAINKAAGDVQISVDNDTVVVEAGGARVRISTLPAGDFPNMEFGGAATRFTLNSLDAMRFVQCAVSTEETRYYLNGVYIHTYVEQGERQLRFVATDGHRMMIANDPVDSAFPDVGGAIIPRKTVEWLLKHFGKADEIEVELTDARVRFTTATGTMTSRLIDGSFPDYMRCIPRDMAPGSIRFAPEAAAVITRLLGQSSEKSRSIQLTTRLGKVEGRVRNMEGGEARAELPGETTGRGDIGFNGGYVLDALSQGPATIRFGESYEPARIDYDQPGRMGVLMPLRT